MREEECYWPAPWRPKMKTLVTTWPSNVVCATDLHLEDRRWKLWWRSGRATSSPFFRFISCFLLLSGFSPSLSVYLFFSLFFVRGFYFSSVFGPSFFSLFFCFVFFLFFFLFLLPLLATTPSPFIRPKSVVTAGLLNAL